MLLLCRPFCSLHGHVLILMVKLFGRVEVVLDEKLPSMTLIYPSADG